MGGRPPTDEGVLACLSPGSHGSWVTDQSPEVPAEAPEETAPKGPWDPLMSEAHDALQNSDFEAATVALVQAAELSVAANSPGPEASARGLLAQTLFMLDRKDDALVEVARAYEIAVELEDQGAQESLKILEETLRDASPRTASGPWYELMQKGSEAMEAGDFQAGVDALEAAVKTANEAGTPEPEATALGMLAQGLFMLGRKDDGLQCLERALGLAADLGDANATKHFETLQELLMTQDGPPTPEDVPWNTALTAGVNALKADAPDKAVEPLTIAAKIAGDAGAPGPEASAHAGLAHAHLALGQPESARPHAARALEIAETLKDEAAVEAMTHLMTVVNEFEAAEPS